MSYGNLECDLFVGVLVFGKIVLVLIIIIKFYIFVNLSLYEGLVLYIRLSGFI